MTLPSREPEGRDSQAARNGPYVGAWAAAALLVIAVVMASGAIG